MASQKVSPEFRIQRLDAQELAEYSRLSELLATINHGFGDSKAKHPRILRPKGERFESQEQFLNELGSDVVLFLTTVRTSDWTSETGKETIVATASYKPYESAWLLQSRYDAERKRVFGTAVGRNMTKDDVPAVQEALEAHTKEKSQDDIMRMEIVVIVTSPEWQGHGLASQLLTKITDEVNARAKDVTAEERQPIFKLLVRTAKEINEPFWKKMGFRTIDSRFFEAGLFGSVEGFHLVNMVRQHEVS